LLSILSIGYRKIDDIGSPPTPPGYIWPISLLMQALASNSNDKIKT